MTNFSNRSLQAELMDFADPPVDEFHRNLQEIVLINKLTGGPSLTWKGVKQLLPDRNEQCTIADIGSGAGDTLLYISRKLKNMNRKYHLTGVDILPEAIDYVKMYLPGVAHANWINTGYEEWFDGLEQKPDIITASLFCHHLPPEKLKNFLQLATKNARYGVVINDLHRHALPYYFIKVMTTLFSRSRFTKNDAPLSVLKGFTKQEWKSLLEETGCKNYQIQWRWAFRHLITIKSKT